jgi:hypothetical protein
MTKDNQFLFSANEDSLSVDDTLKNKYSRIVRFIKQDGSYHAEKIFAYPLNIEGKNNEKESKGIADLLPLDKDHLLTLERFYLPERKKQIIKIFLTTLSDQSTNLIDLISRIDESNTIALEKQQIFDFSQLEKTFKGSDYQTDNFEGISFGPILPSGNPSLILVSDNNFNPKQKTIFVVLELIIPKLPQ